MKKVKADQLGMNPSTASNRLVKDILFNFIINSGHTCHRCNKKLTREDFSIEHIEPWLHTENPVELYFNLDNIAYSHSKCNSGNTRPRPKTHEHPSATAYRQGCRCRGCKDSHAEKQRKYRSKF